MKRDRKKTDKKPNPPERIKKAICQSHSLFKKLAGSFIFQFSSINYITSVCNINITNHSDATKHNNYYV